MKLLDRPILNKIHSQPINLLFPILSHGSMGNDVKVLQEYLSQLGYEVTVEGLFDLHTEATVKKLQQEQGLKVDGRVGPVTWKVVVLQKILKDRKLLNSP